MEVYHQQCEFFYAELPGANGGYSHIYPLVVGTAR